MTGQTVDLGGSLALTRRAGKHFEEFREAIRGDALWHIVETQYPATAEWSYSLKLERGKLKEIEPIVADCANNLISALDQLAAALARANGHQRLKNLYYPFGSTNADYQTAIAKYQNVLAGYEAILANAHANFLNYVPHVAAAKEISNTSKHWALLPSSAVAHAVAWQVPGLGQKIAQIPAATFEVDDTFEFHRGLERLHETPMTIVIKLALTGLSGPIQTPDMILECALRYVEGVVSEVSSKTA